MQFALGDVVEDALSAQCARRGGTWVTGTPVAAASDGGAVSMPTAAAPDVPTSALGPIEAGVAGKLPWWAWLLIGGAALLLVRGERS